MTQLAIDNFHLNLERTLGIYVDSNGVLYPKIQNVTKNVDIYGYLEQKQSEKLFKSTFVMTGLFSAKYPTYLENGDLIYDRYHQNYGYVTELQLKDYGYTGLVYMCNSEITIAHPNETLDSMNRKTIDWTTTVHHTGMNALISLENVLRIENEIGSLLDRTLYYCYLQYSATVHQGDRIYDGTKYYNVKNIDDISWNSALKCLEMVVTNA